MKRGQAAFVSRPWILVIQIALCALPVAAQFESATLTGVVTDPADAVVSGAAIRAVNEDTNIEAAATTDDAGRFVFGSLRPGPYRVMATARGFKELVVPGVVLQVNQAARFDVKLAEGKVTERVTVAADAALLETESGSRGVVIDHTKMSKS